MPVPSGNPQADFDALAGPDPLKTAPSFDPTLSTAWKSFQPSFGDPAEAQAAIDGLNAAVAKAASQSEALSIATNFAVGLAKGAGVVLP